MKRAFLLLALVTASLAGCRGWTSEQPPIHINPNMDTQEKGKAYRKHAFFADGRSMRMPVEGTVARGFLRDDDGTSRGIGADGQPLQDFPAGFTADVAAAQRGKDRWGVYCAPCHGAQ
jgi:hypothetical protein